MKTNHFKSVILPSKYIKESLENNIDIFTNSKNNLKFVYVPYLLTVYLKIIQFFFHLFFCIIFSYSKKKKNKIKIRY